MLPEHFYAFVENFPSVNTRTSYVRDLQDFVNFAGSDETAWTLKQFIDYRDDIATRMTPATVNRKVCSVRSFLDWCRSQGRITINVAEAVKLPKIQVREPTLAFTDREVVRIVKAPNRATLKGATHGLILSLLFQLGVRRSEIVNIRCADLRSDRGQMVLTIYGKGQKSRELPISDELMAEITAYKQKWADIGETFNSTDFLIPVGAGTVYRIVKRYAKAVGIDRRVGAHSCRATAISHLLDTQKVPIRDVADFAGHSSINTTAGYDKKRKGILDSAAPKVNYES